MRLIKIDSWHFIGEGEATTDCGRVPDEDAPVRDTLDLREMTCESCLRNWAADLLRDERPPVEKAGAEWSSDFPIGQFHQAGLLWAVNQFLLWPLGLALVATVEGDDDRAPSYRPSLRVGEWRYADDHIETIEGESVEQDGSDDRWLAFRKFTEERISRMPEPEAKAARARLGQILYRGRPEAFWVG